MWPNNVTKKDLKIEFFRGSGPGGQNKNKRDTACRITHIPTGISSICQDESKQGRNKKIAFRRLADKLVPLMKKEILKVSSPETSSETVRTYHEPRNKVIDKRVKEKSWDYYRVLKGKDLENVIEEVNKKLK